MSKYWHVDTIKISILVHQNDGVEKCIVRQIGRYDLYLSTTSYP